MQVYLRTDRLLLRRFTGADVENLVSLDADPDDRCPGFGRWAVVELATGDFVGWFALRPPDGDDGDEVELGYRLRRSVWGRGYATEGSRALVDKALAELGVQRVFAETMAVNISSRRVLEKAGLLHVRTFHLTWDDPIEGAEHGEVEYELRRADWESKRAPESP